MGHYAYCRHVYATQHGAVRRAGSGGGERWLAPFAGGCIAGLPAASHTTLDYHTLLSPPVTSHHTTSYRHTVIIVISDTIVTPATYHATYHAVAIAPVPPTGPSQDTDHCRQRPEPVVVRRSSKLGGSGQCAQGVRVRPGSRRHGSGGKGSAACGKRSC